MPTYQYRCTECGNELEVVQKFTDPVLTHCEACNGALRKVYNPVGVVFKGSGFYATDNRTSSRAKTAGAKKDAPTSSSTESSSGSTTSSTASSGNSERAAS
ncbi:MAG: zinc ribbon domain-containing protein [Propionibacterium sp.]|nr:zinc ribbon domain-containing protein [Propionibacterium sp.]